VNAPLDALHAIAIGLNEGDLVINAPDDGTLPSAEILLGNGELSVPAARRAALKQESGPDGSVIYRSKSSW
jgi:hypothetical protein